MVHNKQSITQEQEKQIRKMFCQKMEMKEIQQQVQLTERVIRRIIKENNWSLMRNRYYMMLCQKSLSQAVSLSFISEQTGVGYYTLCRIRKKYQIQKAKRKAWNDRRSNKLEQKIIKLYEGGKTGQQIVDKLGYKRRETVYQILEKHKVERREAKRQTYYDETFFEQINTHEKAYVLGLIMTDGNIIKNYNGFEIQLTKEDGYILEKIGDLIGASKTHPIQKINCAAKRRQEGFASAKDMERLTVHNKKIASDLKNMGVVRQKTKILRYNNCVPEEFLSSFFRGLMDGDGTIGFSKNGFPWCHICTTASFKFAEDLVKLNPNLNIDRPTDNLYNVRVGGGKSKILEFIKGLYEYKGDLYLRRKYEKMQNQIS